MSESLVELECLHTYFWGKDRFNFVSVGGKSYTTLDITLFQFKLHPCPDDHILLVRQEYIAAYDTILARTHQTIKSATLVTGQAGNGKTLFLFYILVLQLLKKEPIALQINSKEFAFFDHHGVSIHPAVNGHVPKGTWLLSDSSPSVNGPCEAFEASLGHVIHTSLPASHHWNGWVKYLNAHMFIMDVFSLKELQVLLTIKNLDVQAGVALFQKYGPNPRTIINILSYPNWEARYLHNLQAEAFILTRQFRDSFLDMANLDFSSEILIFRPDFSNSREPVLNIPTSFLSSVLGIALSQKAAAQQYIFFQTLKQNPPLYSVAEWLFKSFAHVCLSDPTREPLQVFLSGDQNPHLIPAPHKFTTGSLTDIQPPYNFYWQSRESDFPGVDAVICDGNIVWALHFTISASHSSATQGLTRVFSHMNCKTGFQWKLVIVGPRRREADVAQYCHRLDGEWKKVPVYACELPFGEFTKENVQLLQNTLDKFSDRYPVDQGENSDAVL